MIGVFFSFWIAIVIFVYFIRKTFLSFFSIHFAALKSIQVFIDHLMHNMTLLVQIFKFYPIFFKFDSIYRAIYRTFLIKFVEWFDYRKNRFYRNFYLISYGFGLRLFFPWGLAVSKDNGRTWSQTIVEKDLLPDEIPLEQSMIDLGNGRFLMLSRLSREGISVQFVSSDYGMTWRKQSTNTRDIKSNTPTLHFDRETGSITCCYYQKGAGALLRRAASANRIFEHPEEWSAPEILYYSGCTSDFDSGNANMTQSEGIQLIIFYEGTAPLTSILMISKSC